MSKMLILTVILLCIISNISYSQMQNKWEFVDSLEHKDVKIGENDLKIYFTFNRTSGPDKSISYFDKNNIVALASWHVDQPQWIIRKTSDGGITWKTIYRDTTEYFQNGYKIMFTSIFHPSSKKIILLGYYNQTPFQYFLKYTNDVGKTWQTMVFDTSESISDLCMLDSSYGIISYNHLGKDSLMITEDGLRTFKSTSLPEYIKNITQVVCVSKNTFLILSNNYQEKVSYLYKTENGGNSWALIKTPKQEYFNRMKFLNQKIGFIEYNNDLYKTTDGGNTWINISIDNGKLNYIYQDFDFSDENKGVVFEGAYGVYLTNNGGQTWFKEDIPSLTDNGSIAIALYPPQSEPYIGYYNYFICKRTQKRIFKSPKIDLIDYDGRFVLPKGNKINWGGIEGADKYELKINQYNFSTMEKVKLTDTVVNDRAIVLNLNYKCMCYFQIRAFNDSMSSEFSSPQYNIYTVGDSNEIPSPLILYPRLQSEYPLKFTAYWTSEKIKIDTFDVELYKSKSKFSVGDNPAYKVFKKYDDTDTSLIINNLLSDSTYILYVRSRKNGKISRWSSKLFHASSALNINNQNPKYKDKHLTLEISPNPSKNICKATISNDEFIDEIKTVKLYNFYGEEIKNIDFRISNTYKDKHIDFNVSGFPNGIYFLMISTKYNNLIGKIIISR